MKELNKLLKDDEFLMVFKKDGTIYATLTDMGSDEFIKSKDPTFQFTSFFEIIESAYLVDINDFMAEKSHPYSKLEKSYNELQKEFSKLKEGHRELDK